VGGKRGLYSGIAGEYGAIKEEVMPWILKNRQEPRGTPDPPPEGSQNLSIDCREKRGSESKGEVLFRRDLRFFAWNKLQR